MFDFETEQRNFLLRACLNRLSHISDIKQQKRHAHAEWKCPTHCQTELEQVAGLEQREPGPDEGARNHGPDASMNLAEGGIIVITVPAIVRPHIIAAQARESGNRGSVTGRQRDVVSEILLSWSVDKVKLNFVAASFGRGAIHCALARTSRRGFEHFVGEVCFQSIKANGVSVSLPEQLLSTSTNAPPLASQEQR